jgi:lipopolysaccharide/colanic/teichoic acid biosynthesis glycosyltransferase
MPGHGSLAFERNPLKTLAMINASPSLRRYGSSIRGARYTRVSRRRQQGAVEQMRRLGDRVIAALLLAITFPLMFLIALAIKSESPGPVLVRYTCIGQGGRRFQILKFRTTMLGPEHGNPAWARKTTQTGQFLRYTRIEALPQLINVLRGEMSMMDPDGSSPSFLD